MITEYLGIYQIHWCIHGSVVGLPFSLTDVATPEEASSIIEKTLRRFWYCDYNQWDFAY